MAASKLVESGVGGHEEGVASTGNLKSARRQSTTPSPACKSRHLGDEFDNASRRIDKVQEMVQEQINMQREQSATTQKHKSSYTVQAEEESKLVEEVLASADLPSEH